MEFVLEGMAAFIQGLGVRCIKVDHSTKGQEDIVQLVERIEEERSKQAVPS